MTVLLGTSSPETPWVSPCFIWGFPPLRSPHSSGWQRPSTAAWPKCNPAMRALDAKMAGERWVKDGSKESTPWEFWRLIKVKKWGWGTKNSSRGKSEDINEDLVRTLKNLIHHVAKQSAIVFQFHLNSIH